MDDENVKPELNQAIWEAHVQQLIPCKSCGRTFFPDRIVIHQKSCKGGQQKRNKNLLHTTSDLSNSLKVAADNLFSSPQPVRRQLHSQQDAVIVVKSQEKNDQ